MAQLGGVCLRDGRGTGCPFSAALPVPDGWSRGGTLNLLRHFGSWLPLYCYLRFPRQRLNVQSCAVLMKVLD